MKRLLGLIIMFLCLFTFSVKAADIDITNVEVNDKTHYVDELNNPTIDGSEINYNLKFLDYQQYIVYKVTLKNNTSHDYNYELKLNESNILYELLEDDGLIGSKSSKDILLKVNYKNEISDDLYELGKYTIKDNLQLLLTGPESNGLVKGIIEELKNNPKTGRFFNYGLVLFFIIGGTIIFIRVKKITLFKYYGLIVLLIIPMIVYASGNKTYTINMNINAEVEKPTIAILNTGSTVNAFMKRLAGNSSGNPSTEDIKISRIVRSFDKRIDDSELTQFNYLQSNDSDNEIVAWYDDTDNTIYYYSNAVRVLYNVDCGSMFMNFRSLGYIDDIKSDIMMNASAMFMWMAYDLDEVNIDLSNWNVENLVRNDSMFQYSFFNDNKVYLNLSGWNMDKIQTFNNMLYFIGKGSGDVYINLNDWSFENIQYVGNLMYNGSGYSCDNFVVDANNWSIKSVCSAAHIFDSIAPSNNLIINARNWNFEDTVEFHQLYLDNQAYSSDSNINIDFSNLNAPKATSLDSVFKNVYARDSYITLNVSDWNTPNATVYSVSFSWFGMYAKTINIIGLNTWDVSGGEDFSGMFSCFAGYSHSDIYLDLSSWDMSSAKNIGGMFMINWMSGNYGNSVYVNVSGWDTSNVTNANHFMSEVGSMSVKVEIYASDLDFSNESSNSIIVEYLGNYHGSSDLSNDEIYIDISNWKLPVRNSSGAPVAASLGRCNDKTTIKASNWDLRGISYNPIREGSPMVNSIDIDLSGWILDDSSISERYLTGFVYESQNAKLDLSNWDVSRVTKCSKMFSSMAVSTENLIIDMSNWDTSNMTDMSYMFEGLMAGGWKGGTLDIIGIEDFDTSNVINMSHMFNAACMGLNNYELDLTNWNVSNVTDMTYMFASYGYNSKNSSVNLSNWNVSNVTDFSAMFGGFGNGANGLNVDITGWNMSSSADKTDMFEDFGKDGTNVTVTGYNL